MSIDYLDPFRPPERVDQPRERRETDRSPEVERDRERPQREAPPDDTVRRDDPQEGNTVDEYA
jgi:hypothetical protein